MKAGHFNRPINRQIQYNMTTEIEIEKEKLKAARAAARAAYDAASAASADVDAARRAWAVADSTFQDAWKKAGAAYDAYEDYKKKNKLK